MKTSREFRTVVKEEEECQVIRSIWYSVGQLPNITLVLARKH